MTLKDMLRACVIDFKGSWDDHFPLIEFAYNNSYHSGIQMAPYEELYGHRCRSPVCWFDVAEATLIRSDSVNEVMEKVQLITDRLKPTQSRQKSHADVRKGSYSLRTCNFYVVKANVVVDTLNRLSMGSVAHVGKEKKKLAKGVHRLGRLRVCLTDTSNVGVIVQNVSQSSLVVNVKEKTPK
ncbi:hypothetical protein MTR67_023757 [Solanum verrucosum]|uniref:Polyprotein n=1 Tax=Solanum verrucosum TaxID=315347 RepID=A0AAF0QU50_SOLVR|nr:hypothetical protein MTR67_023757 [Solanum verrucosum]